MSESAGLVAKEPEEAENGANVSSVEWNPTRDSFPMALVWTPIPVLTWLLPIVGHLGIATTDGIIHDFAGQYVLLGRAVCTIRPDFIDNRSLLHASPSQADGLW
jgi:hypothetical protein